MKFGVVVFPGTWSDFDCYHVIKDVFHQPVEYVWHKETNLSDYDCIILPGGFSYGDYLRTGAIARFSPVMGALRTYADRGGLIIGICNGFQILCEAGLLPGALMRNNDLLFHCEWVNLRVENVDTPFTLGCLPEQVLAVPISHGEGNYYADEETLQRLEARGQVIFRYSTAMGEISLDANPNGSVSNIAGIVNEKGNILGMMPHPERCCEELLGGTDGRYVFGSIGQMLRANLPS
jgi:phosphoribosylformylglycinamidine synthase I